MAYVAVSASPIHVRQAGGVDPGYGQGGLGPDQGLPSGGDLVDPGYGVPIPPPGVWPPPVPSHPIVIAPPDTPPGAIWPAPGLPTHPIAGGGMPPRPDQGLPPVTPGGPDQGLPRPPGMPAHPISGVPSGKYWVIVIIPGYGWRYVCIDPSLTPTHPIAGGGAGSGGGTAGQLPVPPSSGSPETKPVPPVEPKR
jgi:hypothetical protein